VETVQTVVATFRIAGGITDYIGLTDRHDMLIVKTCRSPRHVDRQDMSAAKTGR
jgi:hypothetical protein